MTQHSYIPEKYAKIGMVLSLKGNDNQWDEGWLVKEAGNLVDEPMDSHEAIKRHRKQTGDSLPKMSGK